MDRYSYEIEESVQYLSSDHALDALAMDCYWPKWDAPWWQMSVLYEMGLTAVIPELAIEKLIESLNRIPLKVFPFHPGDIPEGVRTYKLPCHCHLGNVYSLLAQWGVDVDCELPWIRPWLLRYQLADGGLNCDYEAYTIQKEVASSMVATVPPFEAILLNTKRPWTEDEKNFLNRAAGFLIERQLILGSSSHHNAEERVKAKQWAQLCFPRFYFYDVLRGLTALLKWSVITGGRVPETAIDETVAVLSEKSSDGSLCNERLSFEGVGTWIPASHGNWNREKDAQRFSLLARVSAVGEVSPFLTREWAEAKDLLTRVGRKT